MIVNILLTLVVLLILYSVVIITLKDRQSSVSVAFMNKDATGSLRGFAIIMIALAHICQYENSLKEILIGG